MKTTAPAPGSKRGLLLLAASFGAIFAVAALTACAFSKIDWKLSLLLVLFTFLLTSFLFYHVFLFSVRAEDRRFRKAEKSVPEKVLLSSGAILAGGGKASSLRLCLSENALYILPAKRKAGICCIPLASVDVCAAFEQRILRLTTLTGSSFIFQACEAEDLAKKIIEIRRASDNGAAPPLVAPDGVPVLFSMRLDDRPFGLIRNRRKTIEMRLFDERRKAIRPGDVILFSRRSDACLLFCRVKALHPFPSFEELYAAFPPEDLGYARGERADPADMDVYYSPEDRQKYGVVGIELEPAPEFLS